MLNFDDHDGMIWFDGALVPWRDANLHVLSHGLHYASCVFEGERAYNGRVFKMTEHHERLCCIRQHQISGDLVFRLMCHEFEFFSFHASPMCA